MVALSTGAGSGVRGRPGRIAAARGVFRMRDDRPPRQVRLAWADASRTGAHWPRSPALVRRSAAAGGAPAGAGTVLGAEGWSGAPRACLNVCNAYCSRLLARPLNSGVTAARQIPAAARVARRAHKRAGVRRAAQGCEGSARCCSTAWRAACAAACWQHGAVRVVRGCLRAGRCRRHPTAKAPRCSPGCPRSAAGAPRSSYS
jgi:hypothetical protein